MAWKPDEREARRTGSPLSARLIAGVAVLAICSLAQSNTGTISGRVVGKESGEAVVRGWVIANSIRPLATVEPGYGARIQSDGSFRIYNVPPGQYLMNARAPGYRNSDESGESTTLRVLDVNAGGTADIALRLQRMGVISGTVLDEDGFPVERAGVSAFPVSKDGKRARQGTGGGNGATTDDQGRYRISGLAAGSYLVRSVRTGANYLTNVRDHSSPNATSALGSRAEHAYHPNAATPDEASVVTVGPGEDRFGIDISYPDVPGFPISGIVLNPDGSPRPGVPVMVLRGSRRHPFAITGAHASSGPDGRFSTQPLPPGNYLLEVNTMSSASSQTLPLAAYANTQLSSGPGSDVVLQLRPPPVARGELSLPRQAFPQAGSATRAPARPRIMLIPDEATANNSAGFNRIGNAHLDSLATFTIGPLRPGAWRLEVESPDPGWYVSEATLGGQNLLTGAATVDIGVQEISMNVVIKDGAATLRGTVPVPEGAGPQACFLRLYPVADREGSSPHVKQVYCDEQGNFTATAVAPGRYKAFLFTMEERSEADLEALAGERWESAPTIAVAVREEKVVKLEWP